MSTARVGLTTVVAALAGVLTLASPAALPQSAATQPSGGGDQLEEVVVTAQFRAETAQETPISITAVTGEQLLQQGAQNIIDVAEQTPNVTMRQASTGSGRSNQAFIRGIGQGDFLLAYSPRVAFYVDDVYFSTVFGSIFDLMDVDHVEVLRGPQGTLFGRNAVGGAIRRIEEQRTRGMARLARRLGEQGVLRPDVTVEDAAHLLWLLTSFDAFDQLYAGRGLSAEDATRILVMTAERSVCR